MEIRVNLLTLHSELKNMIEQLMSSVQSIKTYE